MKSDFVDVSDTRKQLNIEVPADQVDAEIDRVTRDYGRAARIPGFRPGKVPLKVVKQRFREQILHDVAHDLVPRAVGDAIREHGVEPIDAPDVDVHAIEVREGEPLRFTATFETAPPVDPGHYADIRLRRSPVDVGDEAVDEALERLRQRAARFEPVEGRGVEKSDTLSVDLERRALENGVAGPGEKHENVSLEVGAAVNPPGFDDELIGLNAGDAKTFRVRYPADHAVKELAGTEVEYTVRIRAIRRRVVPPVDDDLAKEVSDVDTVEKLREQLREQLIKHEAREAERKLRSDLVRVIAGKVTSDVPEVLVERELDRRTEEFVRTLFEQGVDPRKAGIDWEAFRKDQRPTAEEGVKAMLVLDEVARRENLEVGDEDVSREIDALADRSGRSAAAVRARLEKDDELDRLRSGMRRERALEFLLSRATIAGA